MLPSPTRHPLRGSALISVVVFTAVALLLVASLLSWSSTERRLNYRNALRLEARNAAEAAAEYGFSQIRQKMETRSTVSLDPDGPDALVKPPASFWTGGYVADADIELIGGTIVQVGDYYYDPGDINNEADPLKGKYVFRRDIRVLAKATVRPPSVFGRPITSYVSQRISIRGAPLFAHAIFYNMDLEIFNGPAMTISGPVHTNGNLYVYPETGALTFTDQVTTTGRIYHAAKPGDASNDGKGAAKRTADVMISNKAGTSLSLKVDGVWKDSTQGGGTGASDWTAFRDYATQRWNGNLQTNAHGVENYTPAAVSKYVEDASPSNGIDNSVNTGRTLIEPPNYPSPSDPDYARKLAIEEQKYANNAGLYLTVNPVTQSITLTSRSKEDPAKNKVLTLPASGNLVKYKAYKATSTYKTTTSNKQYAVTATGNGKNGGKNGEYKYTPTTTSSVATSTITYTSSGAATTTAAPVPNSPSTGSQTGWRTSPPSDHNQTVTTSTSPTSPILAGDNDGMYDQRRQKGTDLVEIDMDALRLAVAAMGGTSAKLSTGSTASPTANDAIGGLTTDDWTGIIYVEVQGGPTTDPLTGATTPATIPASMQTSVRLINGTGKVPSYGTATEGLTIATNAPVYVKGNFNADGNVSTTSPNSATTPETGEVPAAIAGDAVTILSKDFKDSTSLSTLNPTATTNSIEIAAALLVGLSPSNKDGNGRSSGGAHNLPRFLENWGSKNTFIRGSLVALFENRIFTEPHGTSSYYGAPNRYWGFNSMFREGRYPPGTPRVMSYRRVDFTDMTAAEYESAKASFDW